MRATKYMTDVRHLILMRSFRSIYRFTKTDIEVFINTLGVSEYRLIDLNCFINAKSCLQNFLKLSTFQSLGVIVINVEKKEGESVAEWARGNSCTTSSQSLITEQF